MRILSERPLLSLPLFSFSFLCVVIFLFEGFGPHHSFKSLPGSTGESTAKSAFPEPIGCQDLHNHPADESARPYLFAHCFERAILQKKSSLTVDHSCGKVTLTSTDAMTVAIRKHQSPVRSVGSSAEEHRPCDFHTGESGPVQPEIMIGSTSC